ncbi:MAG: U32 family peptidase C-terminal domain-containing protein [Methanomicrobiales archaeon]|nr:U32 family peptidase C-terminal domain-containing protein [Methanomicrobiales archaeon]
MEKVVGKVTHYFPKAGVAVVHIEDVLHTGDQVRISGPHMNFSQRVTSMQIEHQTIASASKGQDIGMKVQQPVREGDLVYRITPE